ncbi:hypothetical protein OG426_06375 [Streptomyces canus]|uniref:hypothetical protein n=1 Tax=Streptomyces canus TaxID=58343 RepID=UPI00386911F4|nr:hypothetical protein OG426_06375 [Streptomyces canus]
MILSGEPAAGDLSGGVRSRPMPPGRGHFVSHKGGSRLVQTGWLPEPWTESPVPSAGPPGQRDQTAGAG